MNSTHPFYPIDTQLFICDTKIIKIIFVSKSAVKRMLSKFLTIKIIGVSEAKNLGRGRIKGTKPKGVTFLLLG